MYLLRLIEINSVDTFIESSAHARKCTVYLRLSRVMSKDGGAKMAQNNLIPRKPDFKGDGVAVWRNTDKNGKEYLSIKILNSITVAAFLPKEEKKESL